MDKFEQKEMKKIRPVKDTWHDWLINFIPEHIRKSVSGFENEIVRLFDTSTPKKTVYGGGKKLRKPNTKKQSEENKINSMRNPVIIKKKKKEIRDRIIKDRIIRDIWTIFEKEEDKKKKEIREKKS